ncbi:class I SAM-dependent methyltransferase [Halieaceae bacterium IMCC14734]|uniref:Class I SAM-dependent methyltransferase n=1 Tax=Candidatus Litorirhabdus singularis TaxID=2518993 RepID=A0ABT3TBZ0_9GAMM|nr:cyclopropane-fatty-acyl-phospholipid synthase [Candidatus Litorirhabdus singularis]MCX2979808.1 class I SAM-dependent methyltransferase [Candidatus Litorirhabdus singularis]
MNDISVSRIRLPQLRGNLLGINFARRTLLNILERLAIGTLTIYDGEETLRFGDFDQPAHMPHAQVRVNNQEVYRRVLMGGSMGSGESYILGHWSSPDLTEVIRLFTANMSVLENMDQQKSLPTRIALKLAHLLKNNTLTGSRKNIAAHYDLGNDFFELFLDPTMMYSAAVFPDPEATLEAASEHKLDLLCQQLELQPEDHLLEIGTGWGGMAVHAARHYGCKVTTTTISREQYEYSVQRVRREGLEQQVTVLCEDYRDLTGEFDKLVSVEMIEAVGHQFYQNYFSKCSSLLKPQGLMVIQAITIADQRYEAAKRSVDFIQRYIFPGGCLPSVAVIGQHIAQDTDMQVTHLRDITEHYADTLAQWRESFFAQLETVKAQGFDDEFVRMWEFYLCYCEGGFRERVISTVQLTFAKPRYRVG